MDGEDVIIFVAFLENRNFIKMITFHLVTPQFWSYKTAGNFLSHNMGMETACVRNMIFGRVYPDYISLLAL